MSMKHERDPRLVRFTKMHGAGNDYIYVDTFRYPIAHPEACAVAWSDRHKGIGSDGLVLIGPPTDAARADFSMRIFNADGSEAMMCGNASRCIGKYLYERGLTRQQTIRLETRSGVKVLSLQLSPVSGADGGPLAVASVTVDMGQPRFSVPEQYREKPPEPSAAPAEQFGEVFVSMGNPHWVVFVDDLAHVDVAGDGGLLECDERFPQRCNIEFAQVLSAGTAPSAEADGGAVGTDGAAGVVRVRVWERGSGITMACGTGACATAVAAMKTGRVRGNRVQIVMDGGELFVTWAATDGHVSLSGPAEFVFEGEVLQVNDSSTPTIWHL